ncbi:MAG: polysaccharide biosynthesis protein [Bacteroidales bacterium]|nr:polysaccharide biosynthesis protein [Bacteroidales bacterium]
MRKLVIKFCDFIFGKQSNGSLPRFWILVFDMVIVIASYLMAMVLLYFNDMKQPYWSYDWNRIIIVPVVYFIMFLIFKTYEGLIRYSGFNDIRKIVTSNTFALSTLIFSKLIIAQINPSFCNHIFPRYFIIVYHYFITLVLTTISRLSIRRIYNEFYKQTGAKSNALVYGAGEGGLLLYRTLSQDQESPYHIFAFVDDNPQKVGKKINTISIISPKKAFDADFLKTNHITTVILAIPSLNVEKRKKVIETSMSAGLDVKTLPSFTSWYNGKLQPDKIENIKIEDLLGREPIKLDNINVKREIDGKVVLITGAAGSIGSEICRQVLHYNPKLLVMVDQAESPMYDFQFELKNTPDLKLLVDKMVFIIANVKDQRRMEEVFSTYKPQIVYHAAAYKHVPFMEENPYEAVFVNVFGTKNIADLAMKYEAEKFVMISTDKAVNPTNVMGTTKRIAEIYTQSRNSNTKFVTTRFGNVLGSNGSVVPLFKKQIEQGGPITVTDKRIIRYFMTIPEACSLVLEAGSIGEDDDIFVFDMGKPVKIWDLADKMRKLAHKPNIEIKETGLRPGEKLYEELLATKENTIPTENKKIMRAKVREYEEKDVDSMIGVLHEQLVTSDPFKIVAQMKVIVPEFISNNSIFEKLDKHE